MRNSDDGYWDERRAVLRAKHGQDGRFKECPLCGCPIRQPLWQDPSSGGLFGRRAGFSVRLKVELRFMCEICWLENRQIGLGQARWLGARGFGMVEVEPTLEQGLVDAWV